MELTISDAGGAQVVRIEGSLDTQSSPDFQTQLLGLIDQGATKIVINFEKLDFISSSGLRVLLMAAKQLKGSGELRICSLNEVVYDSFDMSGFNTILTVTETEREALEGLG